MFHCMGDDRPFNMKGIGTIQIKIFDGIVRELKKVRYVPQLKRNLISVGALKTLGLVVFIREDDPRLNAGYEGRPPK